MKFSSCIITLLLGTFSFSQQTKRSVLSSEQVIGIIPIEESLTTIVLLLDTLIEGKELEIQNSFYFLDCLEDEIINAGVDYDLVFESSLNVTTNDKNKIHILKNYTFSYIQESKALSVISQLQKTGLFKKITCYQEPIDKQALMDQCFKQIKIPKAENKNQQISVRKDKKIIVWWSLLPETRKYNLMEHYSINAGIDQMVCVMTVEIINISP